MFSVSGDTLQCEKTTIVNEYPLSDVVPGNLVVNSGYTYSHRTFLNSDKTGDVIFPGGFIENDLIRVISRYR